MENLSLHSHTNSTLVKTKLSTKKKLKNLVKNLSGPDFVKFFNHGMVVQLILLRIMTKMN